MAPLTVFGNVILPNYVEKICCKFQIKDLQQYDVALEVDDNNPKL